MPEDRRLAAIMFTDIVGYTALMGTDEDKAFKILRKNREIQRPIIKKYHGEWLKEMGDGILASFHTASDAVRCAGEIQQTAKKEGIALRIGIHSGEVVFEGHDVLGDGVNVASRLEELAQEGCVNISGTVYKDIKNKAGIKTEFIGEKKLKNVEEPVKVYRVVCEEEIKGKILTIKKPNNKSPKRLYFIILSLVLIIVGIIILWLIYPRLQPDTSDLEIKKSIAVLPFRNDSPDQDNEYFCNGMMDDILDHLTNIKDLKVLSRTDVEPYRNTSKSRKEIADELHVANLLEGSVRKQGNQFKITLQLINAETGFHLWSNAYEGEYTEQLFTVQSDIAKKVASALKAIITPYEKETIDKPPTRNIEAYDLVKRGWSNLNKFQNTLDEEYSRKSINLFKNALNFDSTYIKAYPILISFYMNSFNLDSMLYFIDKLKEIDPNNASGFYFHGVYQMFLGNADYAISELTKAIEYANNDHIWARVALGTVYCRYKKDFRKGILYINKAISKCPDETKNIMYSWLINTLIYFGEYKKAEEYIIKSMNIKAGCYEILDKNFVLCNQGRFELALHFSDSICEERQCESFCDWNKFNILFNIEAFLECEIFYRQWEKRSTFNPQLINWTKINWAYVCHKLNKQEESNQIFEELILNSEKSLEKGYMWASLDLSRIYAYRNNKEKCLKYLIDYEEYGFMFGFHDYILIDPLFENMKDDPDFLEIVHRVQKDKAESRDQIQKLIQEGLL